MTRRRNGNTSLPTGIRYNFERLQAQESYGGMLREAKEQIETQFEFTLTGLDMDDIVALALPDVENLNVANWVITKRKPGKLETAIRVAAVFGVPAEYVKNFYPKSE